MIKLRRGGNKEEAEDEEDEEEEVGVGVLERKKGVCAPRFGSLIAPGRKFDFWYYLGTLFFSFAHSL